MPWHPCSRYAKGLNYFLHILNLSNIGPSFCLHQTRKSADYHHTDTEACTSGFSFLWFNCHFVLKMWLNLLQKLLCHSLSTRHASSSWKNGAKSFKCEAVSRQKEKIDSQGAESLSHLKSDLSDTSLVLIAPLHSFLPGLSLSALLLLYAPPKSVTFTLYVEQISAEY